MITDTLKEIVNNFFDEIITYIPCDRDLLVKVWNEINPDLIIGNPIILQENRKCMYRFTRGINSGNKCNANTKSGNYCGRHKQYENEVQKVKNILPSGNRNKNPKKIIIRKNKDIDKYWHPSTSLIFKSNTEKIVIGVYRNNKVESLDDDSIEKCKIWSFPYKV